MYMHAPSCNTKSFFANGRIAIDFDIFQFSLEMMRNVLKRKDMKLWVARSCHINLLKKRGQVIPKNLTFLVKIGIIPPCFIYLHAIYS